MTAPAQPRLSLSARLVLVVRYLRAVEPERLYAALAMVLGVLVHVAARLVYGPTPAAGAVALGGVLLAVLQAELTRRARRRPLP